MNEPFDFDEIGKRLALQSQARKREFNQWLDSQPQQLPCSRHADSPRTLDRRESWVRSRSQAAWLAAYAPCLRCRQDRAELEKQEWLLQHGVPRNLAGATLENWHPRDAEERAILEKVRDFAAARRGFLGLLGNWGVGKSHLAVALMRHFTSPQFYKLGDLLWRLRLTYRDPTARNPILACRKADLLIVDELGASVGGRDELPMLYQILDHRHAEFLPTVLTGNLTLPQLRQVLGEQLFDRLRESSFAMLQFAGKSHRPERHQAYFQQTTLSL